MILRTSYFERRLAPGFAILRRVKPLFLIDTDTASDDAVALIMALRSPQVLVLAITTVAGNVAVQQSTRNGRGKTAESRAPERALVSWPGWSGRPRLPGSPQGTG